MTDIDPFERWLLTTRRLSRGTAYQYAARLRSLRKHVDPADRPATQAYLLGLTFSVASITRTAWRAWCEWSGASTPPRKKTVSKVDFPLGAFRTWLDMQAYAGGTQAVYVGNIRALLRTLRAEDIEVEDATEQDLVAAYTRVIAAIPSRSGTLGSAWKAFTRYARKHNVDIAQLRLGLSVPGPIAEALAILIDHADLTVRSLWRLKWDEVEREGDDGRAFVRGSVQGTCVIAINRILDWADPLDPGEDYAETYVMRRDGRRMSEERIREATEALDPMEVQNTFYALLRGPTVSSEVARARLKRIRSETRGPIVLPGRVIRP